tara:strand:- start:57 stop:707 length:651 start_codon:yes stop_codon:yes gene_type:complete
VSRRKRSEQKPMQVVPSEKEKTEKIDVQYELERKIIELLLLYGTKEEDFEELILDTDEKGDVTFKPEMQTTTVFQKIFLDLQEDEIEFTNDAFKDLYYDIINRLTREEDLKVDAFVNSLQPEKASAVTDILMEEEKYSLHDWERNEIYVKEKEHSVSQVVSETILNLRRELVNQKIKELSDAIKEQNPDDVKIDLQDVVDYITLKKVISEKLRRVL